MPGKMIDGDRFAGTAGCLKFGGREATGRDGVGVTPEQPASTAGCSTVAASSPRQGNVLDLLGGHYLGFFLI